MKSTFLGNFDFIFDRAGLDVPTQSPSIAPSNPMVESEVVSVSPSIAPPNGGEYPSGICRSSLDQKDYAPLGVLVGQPAQAPDYTDITGQDSELYASHLVSHRLATRIQVVLCQGNVRDPHLRPNVLTPSTAHSPVIQNMRLTIIFQSMLESAEFFGARLNPSFENTIHPYLRDTPSSGDTQAHHHNGNPLTAMHGPSVLRETQTNTMGKTRWFPCTSCGQRFSNAPKLTKHIANHAVPSSRLGRHSAVVWKGANRSRTVPSLSVQEYTPDTEILADNDALHSETSSEFDLGEPVVESDEQMNHEGAVNALVSRVGHDLSGASPTAVEDTEPDAGEAHDTTEEECSMDHTPRHDDAAILLARGSGGDTI
ncbi:hypothetical protein P167DRAFT_550040 [Morchella conica CCBAS932]|uniref:C2H2-type domain-containing protein n=1 Tax=Morchella conica CCBAS932 TaxID=1392247 RepID=A0A3N4KMQ9_9PEZI|nr:hypothetical protein P167DRAFT_550040 [Morchella conica CCBAS932]